MEDEPGAPGADFREALAGDNLEFHYGLMRRAVQLGRLEQADIIGLALVRISASMYQLGGGAAQGGILRGRTT